MLDRPGRRAGFARGEAGGGDCADRREHQGLADRPHDVGDPELVAGVSSDKVDVHEAARGEDADAEGADVAGVETLHQQRDERDQQQLGQAGPGQDVADLLGVVALHLAEILRQDVDRPEQRKAHQHVGEHADAEVAAHRAGAG